MKIVSSVSAEKPTRGPHELHAWVDPYLRDELAEDQRERFEHALIADSQLQELTRQGYVLQQLSREFPEQLSPAISRWRSPAFRYAMAASLGAALVTVPAWWVQHQLRVEGKALASELSEARQSIAAIALPQAGLAALRLGTTRSNSSEAGLMRKADGVRWAQLLLPANAPSGEAWPDSAAVVLNSESGQGPWRYALADLQANGDPALLVPIATMLPGLYTVEVSYSDQTLARYRFELVSAP